MSNLSSLLHDPLVGRFFKRLIVLFVVLVLLTVASWYAYGEVQQSLMAEEKPKVQKLDALRSQVNFLQLQARLYEQYGDKYQELVKKGLVKEQDRVFWTDSLIRLKDSYVVPNLKFEFSSEKPLSTAQFSNIKIPNGVFFYSSVKLTMDLQHEEDLIRLFESISQKISPLYLVEGCENKLHETSHEVDANFNLMDGNVATQCTLIVFHVHPSKNKNFQSEK